MLLLAVPILIGFGVWQLRRAEWKAALLTELAENAVAPMVVISPGVLPDGLQFRRVRISLDCPPQTPGARAGRNQAGQNGYVVTLDCTGAGEPVRLVSGWGERPDSWRRIPAPFPPPGEQPVEGVLVESTPGGPARWTLVSGTAPAPLRPAAPPSPDTIANNHVSYAIQWFSFAAILLAIYALYVRRWRLAQPEASV